MLAKSLEERSPTLSDSEKIDAKNEFVLSEDMRDDSNQNIKTGQRGVHLMIINSELECLFQREKSKI